MEIKCYWLVKPDCYRSINKILGSKYTDRDIDFFIKKHSKGIYIIYDKLDKWGHMPYPDYENHNGKSDMKKSKNWLKRWGYKYKGEISRKSKLEKLNKIC